MICRFHSKPRISGRRFLILSVLAIAVTCVGVLQSLERGKEMMSERVAMLNEKEQLAAHYAAVIAACGNGKTLLLDGQEIECRPERKRK